MRRPPISTLRPELPPGPLVESLVALPHFSQGDLEVQTGRTRGVGGLGGGRGLWPGMRTEREDLESAMRPCSQRQHEDLLGVWKESFEGGDQATSPSSPLALLPLQGPAQEGGSLRAGHRFQTASLSSAGQRTFRCSGGGDSGQRPLPLTASSPAPLLQFPLALPCSPTSGTALGVWPGGRYKVPGAGSGQPLSPLPPAACWAGRGCSAAPRWPGSLRSSVLANFPGSVPACRGHPVSLRPPGLVL